MSRVLPSYHGATGEKRLFPSTNQVETSHVFVRKGKPEVEVVGSSAWARCLYACPYVSALSV